MLPTTNNSRKDNNKDSDHPKNAADGISLESILNDQYFDVNISPRVEESKKTTPKSPISNSYGLDSDPVLRIMPRRDAVDSSALQRNKSNVKDIMDEFHSLMSMLDSHRIETRFERRSTDFGLYFSPPHPSLIKQSSSNDQLPQRSRSRSHSLEKSRSSSNSPNPTPIRSYTSKDSLQPDDIDEALLRRERYMTGIGEDTAQPLMGSLSRSQEAMPSQYSHSDAGAVSRSSTGGSNAPLPRTTSNSVGTGARRYDYESSSNIDEDSLDRIHLGGTKPLSFRQYQAVSTPQPSEEDTPTINSDGRSHTTNTPSPSWYSFTSSSNKATQEPLPPPPPQPLPPVTSNYDVGDTAIPVELHFEQENLPEIEKLRRIKESLILALQNEKQSKKELEKQVMHLKDAIIENNAQHEVDIDSFKYEIMQLKSQLKKLCDTNMMVDLYELFEKDVARLKKENEILRDENIRLENKELEFCDKFEGGKENSTQNSSFVQNMKEKQQNRLLDKLKKSGLEREALKTAYEEIKSKERQFIVNQKLTTDLHRRLRVMYQECQRSKRESEMDKKRLLDREREVKVLQKDCLEFKEMTAVLREEQARLLSEVNELRNKVSTYEREESREHQLQKFLQKHMPAGAGEESVFPRPMVSSSAERQHQREGPKKTGFMVPLHRSYQEKFNELLAAQGESPLVKPAALKKPWTKHVAKGSVLKNNDVRDPHPWEVDVTLHAMHDSITNNAPSLLPLFRQLAKDVYVDKEKAMQDKANVLRSLRGYK